MITFSAFGGDAKCRDIEKIVDQQSISLAEFTEGGAVSTRCQESSFAPYFPVKYSCVQSASDKGPFSVDEPNTYSDV